jgi:hypothetical protein
MNRVQPNNNIRRNELRRENRIATPDNMEVWYDRHLRLWTAFRVDGERNQLAPAGYGITKADAIDGAAHTENF